MKNKKALILLLSANAISHFAQGISMLAIPWYFTKIVGDPSTFTLIYAIATFITLFWGLYAGALIDRFPRKNIFLTICAISFVVLVSVAAAGYLKGQVPLLLVAFVFCFTLFNYNIHYPTLYAFGQEITEKHLYSKTNSLLEIMGQATNVLSGAGAVMLIEGIDLSIGSYHLQIEPWPIKRIFLMDGMTYLLAMTLIYFIKYIPTTPKKISTEPIAVRLKEGLQYLKNRPLLFYFGNASFTVFIFVLVSTHVLWPIYIDQHLEAAGDVYATTKVHYAIGALLAGFFVSRVFRNQNSVYSIIALMLLALIGFEVLALSQNIYLLFAFALGLGIANAGIRIQRITYLFNHIPNHIIGRTNSVFQSINILLRSIFIGLFSLSFFSKGSNITWAFHLAAIATIISLIPLFWHYRKLRNLTFK